MSFLDFENSVNQQSNTTSTDDTNVRPEGSAGGSVSRNNSTQEDSEFISDAPDADDTTNTDSRSS